MASTPKVVQDNEGKSVAFWHHKSHWRGCRFWTNSYRSGHGPNVKNETQSNALIRSEEKDMLAEVAVYQDVAKREMTQDIDVKWHVEIRSDKRKAQDKSSPMVAWLDQLIRAKDPLQNLVS